MVEIYRFCSGKEIDDIDALNLFYDAKVDEEEMPFCAKLEGLRDWKNMEPYLQKMREIDSKTEHEKNYPMITRCMRILEEQAYYIANIEYTEYKNSVTEYRGKFHHSPIFQSGDFEIMEGSEDVIMMTGGATGPKKWFCKDVFPILEGDILGGQMEPNKEIFKRNLISQGWESMRPMEDSHPGLLDYLVSEEL